VTRMTRDPWPSLRPWHESITITYESWWAHDYYLLVSAIWNSGYGLCSIHTYSTRQLLQAEHAGAALHTKRKLFLTSYTFTPHLIMGQLLYSTDPWPTWRIHICRPIWPM